MQHIDKNNPASDASFKTVVDSYVSSGNYRYDSISADDRRKLRNVLGSEQNEMCAYCMKKVNSEKGTADHVIPKYISESEYGKASGFLGQGLYRRDFIWDKKCTSLSFPNFYPHTLAYGNLVFACDKCNERKDRDLMRPLFFGNPVEINYNQNGLLQTKESDALPNNLKAWLNIDSHLHFRSIWRAVKLSGLTVADVSVAKDENSRILLLKSIQQHITNPVLIRKIASDINRYTPNSMWKELLRFQWFWDYY